MELDGELSLSDLLNEDLPIPIVHSNPDVEQRQLVERAAKPPRLCDHPSSDKARPFSSRKLDDHQALGRRPPPLPSLQQSIPPLLLRPLPLEQPVVVLQPGEAASNPAPPSAPPTQRRSSTLTLFEFEDFALDEIEEDLSKDDGHNSKHSAGFLRARLTGLAVAAPITTFRPAPPPPQSNAGRTAAPVRRKRTTPAPRPPPLPSHFNARDADNDRAMETWWASKQRQRQEEQMLERDQQRAAERLQEARNRTDRRWVHVDGQRRGSIKFEGRPGTELVSEARAIMTANNGTLDPEEQMRARTRLVILLAELERARRMKMEAKLRESSQEQRRRALARPVIVSHNREWNENRQSLHAIGRPHTAPPSAIQSGKRRRQNRLQHNMLRLSWEHVIEVDPSRRYERSSSAACIHHEQQLDLIGETTVIRLPPQRPNTNKATLVEMHGRCFHPVRSDDQELTFTPKLSRFGRRVGSGDNGSNQEVWTKLYMHARQLMRTKRTRSERRLKERRAQEESQCTFTPAVNGRHSPRSARDVTHRLHEESMKAKLAMSVEVKAKRAREISEHCTFTPKLRRSLMSREAAHARSKIFRMMGTPETSATRFHDHMEMRRTIERQSVRSTSLRIEDDGNTFTPTISQRSVKISRNLFRTRKSFLDRMDVDISVRGLHSQASTNDLLLPRHPLPRLQSAPTFRRAHMMKYSSASVS